MLTFLAANMGLTGTELQPALRLATTPQRPEAKPIYVGWGWSLPKSGNGLHVTEAGVPAICMTKEHNCRTRKDVTAEGDKVLS